MVHLKYDNPLGGGCFASSIQQTAGGGYIIAGNICPGPLSSSGQAVPSAIYLLKTNATGNAGTGVGGWAKTFYPDRGCYAESVRQNTDGSYVITGSCYERLNSSSFPEKPLAYVIKTDVDGDCSAAFNPAIVKLEAN